MLVDICMVIKYERYDLYSGTNTDPFYLELRQGVIFLYVPVQEGETFPTITHPFTVSTTPTLGPHVCVIKMYRVWLKDGGQAWWQRVNIQPHQMLLSPWDHLLTTHSSCYWHSEWKESVLSYKNIKIPTKACGCLLCFHVERLLTYLKKLSLCLIEKAPTSPCTLLIWDGVF